MSTSYKQAPTSKVKQNEKTEEYVSNEETRKISIKEQNRISNFPDKEFKVMVKRMLTKQESRIEEFRKNLNFLNWKLESIIKNQELESIIKNQEELNNIITKIKNKPGGINRKLDNTGE